MKPCLLFVVVFLLLQGCEKPEEKSVVGAIPVIGVSKSYDVVSYSVIPKTDTIIEPNGDTLYASVAEPFPLNVATIMDVIFLSEDSLLFYLMGVYESSSGAITNTIETHEELSSTLEKYDAFLLIGDGEDDSLYQLSQMIESPVKKEITLSCRGYEFFRYEMELQDDQLVVGEDTLYSHEKKIYSDTITITDHPEFTELVLAYHVRVINAGTYSYDQMRISPESDKFSVPEFLQAAAK